MTPDIKRELTEILNIYYTVFPSVLYEREKARLREQHLATVLDRKLQAAASELERVRAAA